ncbi:MBL fold metallo-hydrolase [Pseudogemmobacter humi]|uniref:Hydroxyacylglutathione hydrolase n=1 Tax=Pseudogemmobacter humi TaxID=2483812 RepID=A0A3P5XVC1_9RHOB|nr:MBL fold metallo-hydrolase [Pseudogemmobacter humi]VDC32045.1 hydroxyacylglutathione hydrolase [Pseudogemmobacter humi]
MSEYSAPLVPEDLPLRLVRAENPSPMTGPGTNTFLLGQGEVMVIDPGPALPGHLAAILAALDPGERIAAILVTHPHLDHSALAPALAGASGARIYGFGPAGSGRSPLMRHLAKAGLGGGEGVDHGFAPDLRLAGGEALDLAGERIEVVHTPGHMAEHLAFGWNGILFCGDHVMAWSTSLVSPPDGDMGAYLASLHALREARWRRWLPAHGDPVGDPAARLTELIAHRAAREARILEELARAPGTVETLTPRIYHDTPPALWPAAGRNLLAHLADLITRGIVTGTGWPGPEAVFRRI